VRKLSINVTENKCVDCSIRDATNNYQTEERGDDEVANLEGPVFGQQAYDKFTTTLANSYGAMRTNEGSCSDARSAASEAALMDNDAEGLLMIADRQGLAPSLPGGQCGQATLAEARR